MKSPANSLPLPMKGRLDLRRTGGSPGVDRARLRRRHASQMNVAVGLGLPLEVGGEEVCWLASFRS